MSRSLHAARPCMARRLILLAPLAALALGPRPPAIAQGPADPAPAATAAPDQATPPPTETTFPTATATPPRPATSAPGAGPSATTAPDEPAETLPNEERPIIILDRYEAQPGAPAAGQTFRLKLVLRNVGEHFAENIKVGIGSGTFLPVSQGSLRYEDDIDEGDDAELETELRVAADTKAGSYPIAISLRWDDSYGGTYSDETTIAVEVGGSSGAARPVLLLTGTRLPGRVAPGAAFTLRASVLNTGSQEARGVSLAPTQGPLALAGGHAGLVNIPPGGSAELAVLVVAAAVQAPGATSQTIELRYDSPAGEHFADPHALGISVMGEAASGPLPLIEGYRVAGRPEAEVHPGETFDLEIDLVNAGTADALQTRLILGGGGAPPSGSGTGSSAGAANLGVFAPVGASNIAFLDRLAAGARLTRTQRMIVDGAAKPGVYTLEVGFNYVDGAGQPQSASSVISVLVTRQTALVLNPVQAPETGMVGMPLTLMVDLVNQGGAAVSVRNAEIRADPSLGLPGPVVQFIGSLDVGDFYSLQADLFPTEAGEGTITVEVAYVDDLNREQTLTETFEVTVEEPETEPVDPASLGPSTTKRPMLLRILRGLLGLGASDKLVLPEAPPASPGFEIEPGGPRPAEPALSEPSG